jgi:lipid II:glycine glycyltransferase (peptidoglycan interpeptide bridge formation enzyme)
MAICNIKKADLSICDEADSFLQSAMWGRFKGRFGWAASAFTVKWAEGAKPLLVLSRRIAPGIAMAYIPLGPELPAAFPDDPVLKAEAAAELAHALRSHLPRNISFIRFDLPWINDSNSDYSIASESHPDTSNNNPHSPLPTPHSLLKKASANIQPPDTVLVDLTPSETDILAAMKPKWRYNIGLAEKRGVVINETGVNGVDDFYQLLTETAERDGIAIHNAAYYRTLFEECNESQPKAPPIHCSLLISHCSLKLYTATHDGDILASLVALFCGKQATYLYGASANVKRNLMAPYALQWKAMKDAKAFGCTEYDLFGIPPNDDPDHPMAGLYLFKTGFGGKIIHRPGSWDFPCNPVLYALFSTAERLRKKMRDRRKHRPGKKR